MSQRFRPGNVDQTATFLLQVVQFSGEALQLGGEQVIIRDPETLVDRLLAETVAHKRDRRRPPMVGAWARTLPTEPHGESKSVQQHLT